MEEKWKNKNKKTGVAGGTDINEGLYYNLGNITCVYHLDHKTKRSTTGNFIFKFQDL